MKRALVTAVAGLALLARTAGARDRRARASTRKAEVEHRPDGRRAPGSSRRSSSLVKQAGLVGALSGKGPLTVFAPTDAAFAKVPKATLTALGKDKAKLKAVLLYHVVKGKVTAARWSSSSRRRRSTAQPRRHQGQRRQGLHQRRAGRDARRRWRRTASST